MVRNISFFRRSLVFSDAVIVTVNVISLKRIMETNLRTQLDYFEAVHARKKNRTVARVVRYVTISN